MKALIGLDNIKHTCHFKRSYARNNKEKLFRIFVKMTNF